MSYVIVDIFWLPFQRQRGRLVATRRVETPETDETEFWSSNLIDSTLLTDFETVQSTADWTRLLRNERVAVLHGPVPLFECAPGSAVLAEIERRLRRSTDTDSDENVQPLAGAEIELQLPDASFDDRPGVGIHVLNADLIHNPDHPLAAPFELALSTAIRLLEPQLSTPTRVALPELSPDATADTIHLQRVRGIQIGHYNLQINTFIAECQPDAVDFDQVIKHPDVTYAIRALQAEPGNADLRDILVATLQDHGWNLVNTPRWMTVGRQRHGIFDLCERLLGFTVGFQAGYGHLQRNSFAYMVTSTPNAAALLGRDRDLAAALADVLCPPPGGGRDMSALRDRLSQQLEGLPINWADGITRGAQYQLGTVSFLQDHDGASIGDSIVINKERLDVQTPELHLPPPPPPPTATPPPPSIWSPPPQPRPNPPSGPSLQSPF